MSTQSDSHHINKYFAACSDTELFVWNTANGDAVIGPLVNTTNFIDFGFTCDESCTVLVCKDFAVCIWSIETGEAMAVPLAGCTNDSFFCYASLSPYGKLFLGQDSLDKCSV